MDAALDWRGYRMDPALTAFPRSGAMIVYDTEFTAWEGSAQRKWGEVWETREIIQLGAVRLDAGAGFAEQGTFSVVVWPSVNRVLSDYISDLTGITNERMRREGVAFSEAMTGFCDFAAGAGYIASNGWDGAVLRESAKLAGCELNVPEAKMFDMRSALARALNIDERACVSADLPEIAGLASPEQRHDALADARSIAAAMKHLRCEGAL